MPPCLPGPQDRVRIEAEVLAAEAEHCPEHVPAVHAYDARMCIIAMQASAAGWPPQRHGQRRAALLAVCAGQACASRKLDASV